MSITPVTNPTFTVPDRAAGQSPQEFSTNATNLASYIKLFGTELQTTIPELNTGIANANAGIAAAEQAAALANFEGEWGDQTGAANVPYSVSNDGKFWVLIADLADVTTVEPGVSGSSDTYWLEQKTGKAGYASITPAVDTELTDVLVHEVAPTASGLGISLPDQSVGTIGSTAFYVKNSGSMPFYLLSNTGGTDFGIVLPGETLQLVLVAASADGTWIVFKHKPTVTFSEPTIFEPSSGSDMDMSHCKIGDDKWLIVYKDDASTDYPTMIVAQLNNGEIELGSPVVLRESAASDLSIEPMSRGDDLAVAAVVYSNNYIVVYTISIDGLTPTVEDFDNGFQAGADTSSAPLLSEIDEDKWLLVFTRTSSAYIGASVFSISGVTLGAAASDVTVRSTASSYVSIKKLSTDKVFCTFITSSAIYGMVISVSETTPAGGIALSMLGGVSGTAIPSVVAFNGGGVERGVIISATNAVDVNAAVMLGFTIDETTVSVTHRAWLANPGGTNSASVAKVCALSEGNCFYAYINPDKGSAASGIVNIDLDGNLNFSIEVLGPPLRYGSPQTHWDIVKISEGKVALSYLGNVYNDRLGITQIIGIPEFAR
ncbi:MAG: hypothetical protein RKH07_12735 [Gammaproteobacteria bacterium]